MSLSSSTVYSDPYNPPFPEAVTADNDDELGSSSTPSGQKTSAQLLLNLVRLVEKEEVEASYHTYMDETVELMNSLIQLYSRRGLLQGNVAKAERILSSSTQTKKGGTRDKKRNSGKRGTDLQINPGQDVLDGGSDATPLPETLIFTALTRVLVESKEAKLTSRPFNTHSDAGLLVALSAELCLAMSQHIQTNQRDGNLCSAAEYELLAQSGKTILAGLVSKIWSLEQPIRNKTSKMAGVSSQRLTKCLSTALFTDDENDVTPVLSCFRAACSLVNLFKTKLSRSTALLSDLKTVAWQFVAFPDQSVQDAAARLLAAVPLAGGIDRKTPSEIWNTGVADILTMLNAIVDAVAPVSKASKKQETSLSAEAGTVLNDWLSFIRQDISDESDRVNTFRLLLRGLVLSFQHFLSRDGYGHTPGILLESRMDIEMILEIVERFLSYPMSAESLFFRTKKRLRDESVDGGLISSRSIAIKVANEVKRLGHEILDCMISSIGGSALLPFSRRIIRMSYASLLTSCSGPVRKVMDPASGVQLEGKKRRWLHLSMALRTMAVQTVHLVAVAFGSDRTAKLDSSERGKDSKSDGEMALTLVAGCLMEQIGAKDVDESTEETWGSLEERVDLVNSCLECLRGTLSSSNGFLGFGTRSVIDSTVLTCLARSGSWNTGILFGWSSVQCRIFQLASTCVATPWNDGSVTSIVNALKTVAIEASMERDETVSMAAKEALRVCDLFGVPRAPPLVFVHRTIHGDSDRVETSASAIMEDIQRAQVEAQQARAAMETAEKAKALEKRRREADREESNKRKREEAKETRKEAPKQDETLNSSSNKSESKPAAKETTKGGMKPPPTQGGEKISKNDEEDVEMEMDIGATHTGKDDAEAADKAGEVEVSNGQAEADDKEVDDDEEFDEDFPDIVAGGPDSDDD